MLTCKTETEEKQQKKSWQFNFFSVGTVRFG